MARRLQRLEWTTRFRPIHVQALLLTATAPESDHEFLYSPKGRFAGIAGRILAALSIPTEGQPTDEVLTEVQKRGVVATQVLECPVEGPANERALQELLMRHLPSALARVRRSLKPKRVLILSSELQGFLSQFNEARVGGPVFYTPFSHTQAAQTQEIAAFREALPAQLAERA
jgi:hypothetical protein